MLNKGVTLRGLEVFEALANTGTVAQAAETTGLSQPAVSQQLRNLEKAVGIALVDHGKRPMTLTPAGRSFLTRTENVLAELRLAQSEITVMDLGHLTTLSIGVIDDFDNDLTPRLITILADSLIRCRFKMVTLPSHKIFEAMQDRRLHMAISASTGQPQEGIIEHPIVRDPFVVVAPKGVVRDPGHLLEELSALPFLRYDREQLIGRQIDAHLSRHQITFEERFEIGSHLALMAMVARRIGWALTTPLGYMRAGRVHDDVEMFPLPIPGFARQISLFAASDWADQVPRDITQTMRRLVQTHMIDPATSRQPWLAKDLRLIDP
jgi:DNA-binding transcriptional LysR family regulator